MSLSVCKKCLSMAQCDVGDESFVCNICLKDKRIKELESKLKVSEWIDINEKQPETGYKRTMTRQEKKLLWIIVFHTISILVLCYGIYVGCKLGII